MSAFLIVCTDKHLHQDSYIGVNNVYVIFLFQPKVNRLPFSTARGVKGQAIYTLKVAASSALSVKSEPLFCLRYLINDIKLKIRCV